MGWTRASVSSMSDTLNLTIRYEDAGDGWVTAHVAEVPAAISEGRTRAEARFNALDALRTVLRPDEAFAGADEAGDSAPLILSLAP